MDAVEKRHRRVEVLATILLAVAAVATAWSSYQASRWNGEQAKATGKTNKLRIEAARAQGLSEAQKQADLATFTQWVDAYLLGRTELRDFYFKRFRKEFKPAVVAWIATRPLKNPEAPLSPFVMPQYRLAAEEDAKQTRRRGERYLCSEGFLHPAFDRLRARRGALRGRAVLRRHFDEGPLAAPEGGATCHRRDHLSRNARVDRDVSRQLLGLIIVRPPHRYTVVTRCHR